MREGTGSRWHDAERLLCVRLDSLGDVLMTSPAMRALKESRPGRRITLLTSDSGAEGARLLPEIDDVIVFGAPWMKLPKAPPPEATLEMAERLRAGRFDGAVMFTVYSQSPLPAAMLCHLAGISRCLAHCRENPYHLISDRVEECEPGEFTRHEVRRQLDLVAAIGARADDERIRLAVPGTAVTAVEQMLAAAGLDRGRPWAVFHPGTTAPSRQYPPQMFAEAARTLVVEHGWQAVLSGVASEAPVVESVREMMGVRSVSLVGRLSIQEEAALLQLAPLLISNNTGTVHLAAGVGTPVVDLYALTNPQHTPWGVPQRTLSYPVPCAYCYKSACPEGHHLCLRGVTPESVVVAALELAAETSLRARTGQVKVGTRERRAR